MFGLMGVARLAGQPGGAFPPLSLFASGEQGVWYDPSDFSSMFQDSGGTTPVTAVGQPVGKISDKSGNGNHATQATAADRPVLRQDGGGKYYLEFDGVDDCLSTAAVDFSASDEMSLFVGMERSNTTLGMLAELTIGTGSQPESCYLVSGFDQGYYSSASRGDAALVAGHAALRGADDGAEKAVIAATHDISGDLSRLRRNGAYQADGTADKGAGNFANDSIYIGARNGAQFFFNGSIYAVVIVGRVATAGEIDSTEAYIAGKSGVTL